MAQNIKISCTKFYLHTHTCVLDFKRMNNRGLCIFLEKNISFIFKSTIKNNTKIRFGWIFSMNLPLKKGFLCFQEVSLGCFNLLVPRVENLHHMLRNFWRSNFRLGFKQPTLKLSDSLHPTVGPEGFFSRGVSRT